MTELRKFNVKFKGGQLGRTVVETTLIRAWDYMEKKYPKRVIIEIKEVEDAISTDSAPTKKEKKK